MTPIKATALPRTTKAGRRHSVQRMRSTKAANRLLRLLDKEATLDASPTPHHPGSLSRT